MHKCKQKLPTMKESDGRWPWDFPLLCQCVRVCMRISCTCNSSMPLCIFYHCHIKFLYFTPRECIWLNIYFTERWPKKKSITTNFLLLLLLYGNHPENGERYGKMFTEKESQFICPSLLGPDPWNLLVYSHDKYA